jgi:SAM-dependent methyltransferase
VQAVAATSHLTRHAASDDLPPEFDIALYLQDEHNRDLRQLSPRDAQHHYDYYGREEGRLCSIVANRQNFLSLVPQDGVMLEIGPGAAPAFPGAAREVTYLDAFAAEQLRSQFPEAESVPEIDVVWRGEPYLKLFKQRFDAVFAGCSLDHQPCLITHLSDVAGVLKPGARYFVVLPDRRYTVDHYLPDSTFADALDAYAAQRTHHSARALAAQLLFLTHDDGVRHWRDDHGADPRALSPDPRLREVLGALLRAVRANAAYLDARAWQFTPGSFRRLIETLANYGLSPLRVERLYPTIRPAKEFYAVLRVMA